MSELQLASMPDDPIYAESSLGVLDRVTRTLAIGVSRRRLFKSAVLGGICTALGVPLLDPIPVVADSCHTCSAPCGSCSSDTGTCCSPHGYYCWDFTCSCSCGGCGCFYAKGTACDSGANSVSCPCCCFACYPCC